MPSADKNSNILQLTKFALRFFSNTIYHCLSIISKAQQGKLNRASMDNHTKAWSGNLLANAKINLQVVGLERLHFTEGVPYIFMSNHSSVFDIPVALQVFPSARMLAKKEMRSYPLMGKAMEAGDFVFIDRKNLKNAINDLDIAKAKLKNGIRLWVYPEGTRSKDGQIHSFKKGPFHLAQQLNAIIIPVAIVGTNQVLAPHSLRPRFYQKVELRIGKPIHAESYSKETLSDLIAHTQASVRELFTQAN